MTGLVVDGTGFEVLVGDERIGPRRVLESADVGLLEVLAWAVLRAPFELLARPGGGLLAADELVRFCVVRRLGPAGQRLGLDGFRLGLAFMASSPLGQRELDFEAEEAAILHAVGDSRVDLVVDDTGIRSSWVIGWPSWVGCRWCTCRATDATTGRPGLMVRGCRR